MTSFADTALRYNTGKPLLSMLDEMPHALDGATKVLEFGAQKYTKRVPFTVDELLNLCHEKSKSALHVSSLKLLSLEDTATPAISDTVPSAALALDVAKTDPCLPTDYAAHVDTGFAWTTTQKPEKNTRLTSKDIENSPKTKRKNEIETLTEVLTLSTERVEKKLSSLADSEATDSQRLNTKPYAQKDALSAEASNVYMWIIATKADGSEASFAVNATKDSDCLTMTLAALQQLGCISSNWKVSQANNRPRELVRSGRKNYQKGLPLTQIYDSMRRHQLAWLNGEDLDPESGLPHVDHIVVNALFLAELTRRTPHMDDRCA